MSYTVKSADINKDILTRDLRLIQDRNTIFFENKEMIILSPSVQNESWWFDLLIGNVEKAKKSNKRGYLIVRLFNDLFIADLKDFLKNMATDDTLVFRDKNRSNWKFLVKERRDGFFIINQKKSTMEYSIEKVTKEGLINFINEGANSMTPEIIKDDSDKIQFSTSVGSIPSQTLIPHIHSYIKSRGFNYSEESIKNLYLSLRAKPFVIISGISGTGKTKIVQLFAESLGATEENGQFKLVPVRPDWSDGSELLGYRDISGEVIFGQLTKLVLEASKPENQDRPYFFLLDEMNLARVEYYLSDVLSIMESRKRADGEVTSAKLLPDLHATLTLPNNVYIIGTVNMDETTHPFSKKVLDRANTIEFNEIALEDFSFLTAEAEVEPIAVSNSVLEASYLQLKDCYTEHETLIVDVSEKLSAINQILQKIHAQVGYRVRDEISFYLAHNAESELLSQEQALDYCYMQKILPRINGAGADVEKVLEELTQLFTEQLQTAAYSAPLSLSKLEEMQQRLQQHGFTSYWIS